MTCCKSFPLHSGRHITSAVVRKWRARGHAQSRSLEMGADTSASGHHVRSTRSPPQRPWGPSSAASVATAIWYSALARHDWQILVECYPQRYPRAFLETLRLYRRVCNTLNSLATPAVLASGRAANGLSYPNTAFPLSAHKENFTNYPTLGATPFRIPDVKREFGLLGMAQLSSGWP